MLPKKNKLDLGQEARSEILKHGYNWQAGGLKASYDFQADKEAQATIIVPKAAIFKATARNAVRRTIYAVMLPFLTEAKKLRLILRITNGKVSKLEQAALSQMLKELFMEIKKQEPK